VRRAGASRSREGVVRSFGFRKVPAAVGDGGTRASRDAAVRSVFCRGTGILDACTEILDGRGMPLGLVWRVSSMVVGYRGWRKLTPVRQVLTAGAAIASQGANKRANLVWAQKTDIQNSADGGRSHKVFKT
jgi:hypothetical protein